MEINLSCRYFPGDRPCAYHKEEGVLCEQCTHFRPKGTRVLVIKLDALGDVLRTTCLLPSLRRDDPNCHVTWFTSSGAAAVLENNSLIDETLVLGHEGLTRLEVEHFDLVLNPDASKTSAALASVARSRRKRGFGLDPDGSIYPLNPESTRWLEMGGRDDLKRRNRRTYQQHVHTICRLESDRQRIVLELTNQERVCAEQFARWNGLHPRQRVVGLNTGSGRRWPKKRWPRERYLELIARLREEGKYRVLLLGGALERESNQWLSRMSGGFAIDTGSDKSLREYFALLELCSIVVSGDTLGLHAALGLGKRVVALFGPTSPWEVDLYGRGIRIVPDIECVSCYRSHCERSPSCMDLIEPDRVFESVEHQLVEEEAIDPAAGREAKTFALS